jgi:hypothetical protein
MSTVFLRIQGKECHVHNNVLNNSITSLLGNSTKTLIEHQILC